jgi:hypothetical protein
VNGYARVHVPSTYLYYSVASDTVMTYIPFQRMFTATIPNICTIQLLDCYAIVYKLCS